MASGARLGLAVTDDTGHDEVGVVEGGSERMRERVAELATLVDGTGRLGRNVTRDSAGKRELAKETAHAVLVLGDRWVELAVSAFEVRVRDEPRSAVARPGDVEHAQVTLPNHAVEVCVDEIEARSRAEVPKEPRLYVLRCQRLAEERIVQQIHLPNREVVGGAPVRVEELELGVLKDCLAHLHARTRTLTINASSAGRARRAGSRGRGRSQGSACLSRNSPGRAARARYRRSGRQ